MKKFVCIIVLFSIFTLMLSSQITYAETYEIAVNIEGSGTVTPYENGVVSADYNSTQVFTIEPAQGYILYNIKFNGENVWINSNNQYETPKIIENSTLDVLFLKESDVPGIEIYNKPYINFYESRFPSSISFGMINDMGFEIVEYGVIYSKNYEKYELSQVDGNSVRKFVAKNKNSLNQYGIEIIDKSELRVLGDSYYTRGYATYKVGDLYNTVYSDKTVFVNLEEENSLNLNTQAIKGGFKTYNSSSWSAKGELPLSNSDLWLRAKTDSVPYGISAGVSRIGYAEFDLSDLPEDAVIDSATLTVNIVNYGSTQQSLFLYANVCTEEDWDNFDVSSGTAPSYDITNLFGTGVAAGTGLCDITLDTSQIKSNNLVVALRRQYIASEADNNTHIDARNILPSIEIEYHIKYDPSLKSAKPSEGSLYPSFYPDIQNYEVLLPFTPDEIPSIGFETKMSTTQYSVSQASSLDDSTVITTTARDGVTQKTYTFNYRVLSASAEPIRAGYKVRTEDTGITYQSLPGSGDVVVRTNNSAYYSSLVRISYIEFDLSNIPRDAVLSDSQLKLNISNIINLPSGSSFDIDMFICTDGDWFNNMNIYGYPAYSTELLGTINVSGTGLYKTALNYDILNQYLKTEAQTLTITCRLRYDEALTTVYGYIDTHSVLPTLEIRTVVPISEHPRLFLRSGDLPILRQNVLKSPLNNIYENILNAAQTDTTSASSLTIGNVAVSNALKYLIDEDINAGITAKNLALNEIQSAVAADFEGTEYSAYKVNSPFIVACAMVYDWCYDLISPLEKETFVTHFRRFADEILRGGYPDVEISFNSNQEETIKLNYLSMAIAIYDEYPQMYQNIGETFFSDMVPILDFYYPSGWHHQGTNYGLNTRGGMDYFASALFQKMGLGNVLSANQENMPYQYIYMRKPDGELISDGDYSVATTSIGNYRTNFFGVLLPAGYYQNPYFQDQLFGEGSLLGLFSVNSPYYIQSIYKILFVDPNLERKSITELPLTRYFGYPVGAMIARTGWTKAGKVKLNSNEVVAQVKLGVFNTGNHQHTDAGEFEIYYKGNLAIDSGDYQDYNSEHSQNYYQKTIAHNCMLVYDPNETFIRSRTNGGGQIVHAGYNTVEELLAEGKTGEILGHEFGPDEIAPDYSYLKGDLTDAYSDKVSEYKRSFVFLNFKNEEHPAALIVFDKMVASNANFQKYWLLHSEEEPQISGNVTTVVRSQNGYNGKLINHTLLPAINNLQINKIGGTGSEFMVFGENFPLTVSPASNQYGAGKWRIEVKPQNAAQEDLFLNVIQVQDNIGGPTPLEPEKIETTNMVGSKIYDRVVLFSKSGNRLNEAITFTAGNLAESLKFIVTDLKAGTWKIQKQGEADQYKAVTEEGNVLNFEGIGGTYILTYEN